MKDDSVEDILGPIDSQDYKMVAVVEEWQRQDKSVENWIYIGADPDTPWRAKVGLTTGNLGTRAGCHGNPEYDILHAFKIKEGVPPEKVKEIETQIHESLEGEYHRYPHRRSDKPSEWFKVPAIDAVQVVGNILLEKHSWQTHWFHCHDRGEDVINSWKNEKLSKELSGENTEGLTRAPYKATDNNNPTVSAECFMPGGCGRDCECWD